uniref:Ndc10 domain-containing protein n=1 Tax=Dunaliella tertiolecta TaxID=3047 RepID=A0A7S3QMP7_DUNTE|mmetsp:Transcript_11685/g.31843  ORF Transcript_11685/g.31843 Transcript_11685/m.31843 type:complete len:456 (+) Transcript_11685:75-1442(+)
MLAMELSEWNALCSWVREVASGQVGPLPFPPQNPPSQASSFPVNAGCIGLQQGSSAQLDSAARNQRERLQDIFRERDGDLQEDEELDAQLARLSEEETRKLFATSQSLRAPGTQQSYKSALKKFQEFCEKHNYACRDDPKTVDVAVRFFVHLLEQFQERVDNGSWVPAQSTVRGYQSALQTFYTSTNLMAHPPYRAAYHNALKYLQDLEKPPEQDPQTSTPQDALTADHVKAMLVNAAQDGSAHGLQTRAMMALMFQCIARSDDLRLLRFSHLAQAYVVGCVGPQHMMVWQLMVKGSKTEKDGRAQYMCLTRHKDVDVCAVHALGVYLVQRFTLGNELFPDPHEDWEDYLSRPIFIGPKGGSIRYEHQATLIKPYMEAIRHSCSKVCHAFRASGARMFDCLGVPAIVIARMGRWNIDIQHSNYVTDTPVQGLLAAGGYAHGDECFLMVAEFHLAI